MKVTLKVEEPPGGERKRECQTGVAEGSPGQRCLSNAEVRGTRILRTSDWVLVTPTATLAKLTLDGTTEICGCTPVPVNTIAAGELVAVLTTLRLPVTLPVVVGAKLTLSLRLWPSARVTAPVKPLTVKPAPVIEACEMVTPPVPLFVSVVD